MMSHTHTMMSHTVDAVTHTDDVTHTHTQMMMSHTHEGDSPERRAAWREAQCPRCNPDRRKTPDPRTPQTPPDDTHTHTHAHTHTHKHTHEKN